MFRSDGERRSFSIARDMTVIGRREDCDLRIPLGEVSRKHCRLVRDGDSLKVEDLGSSNGTFLNGQRVQEGQLSPGDSIQVGPVVFVLQVDGVPADDELSPVSLDAAGAGALAAGAAAGAGGAIAGSGMDEAAEAAGPAGDADDAVEELEPLEDLDEDDGGITPGRAVPSISARPAAAAAADDEPEELEPLEELDDADEGVTAPGRAVPSVAAKPGGGDEPDVLEPLEALDPVDEDFDITDEAPAGSSASGDLRLDLDPDEKRP